MIKNFLDFLNEGYDNEKPYEAGEIVWIKNRAHFEYKENKPRHKWKYIETNYEQSNWAEVKIVSHEKISDGYYYLCNVIHDLNFSIERGYKTIYVKLVAGDQIKVNSKFVFSEDEKDGNEQIFSALCKEIVSKLGGAKGKITLKNSYEENSLSIETWQVETEGVVSWTIRSWDNKSHPTSTGYVARFLHKEEAEEFASALNDMLQKPRLLNILTGGTAKVKVDSSPNSYSLSEANVFALAKRLGIDIAELKHKNRGNHLSKKSGIV
jgi:hypothetical protein